MMRGLEHYRQRAADYLTLALVAPDEAHQTEAVEMAMYWFKEAEAAESAAPPANYTRGPSPRAQGGPNLRTAAHVGQAQCATFGAL
jgi:hypothetical protein